MQRLRAIVAGRVQGVNFRYHTIIEARRLGLVGYVRNLPGGEVEVVAEGEQEALQRLVEFLHRGPSHAYVRAVSVNWESPTGEWAHFDVGF